MKNKIMGLLFKIPAMFLLIGGFIACVYAKIKSISPVNSYGPAAVMFIIIVFYIIGEYFSFKQDSLF